MAQEEEQQIGIEELELSLEVYEIEGEEKVKKLKELFAEKGVVDLNKMFYEEKSSLEIKFQNIISDLTEFLIKQQIASTDKLRKTFYRILENPLNFLFKVSRFEIFNLRLNAFDIELEPIDAVCQLGNSILDNVQKYDKTVGGLKTRATGGQFKCFQEFLEQAQSRLIQDLLFTFYSYLRKGGSIIKKKFQGKVRVVELYNKIQEKIIKRCIQNQDVKTLKELSILNYELYILENSFDVLCLYLKIPLRAPFVQAFRELQILGQKALQNSNLNIFILIFVRYSKQILIKLDQEGIDPVFSFYIQNALTSISQLWGCRLCYYQQFYQLFNKLLSLHPKKQQALKICLKYNPQLKKDDIVLLRTNFKHQLQQKQSELLSLLRPRTMDDINSSLSSLYHQTLYNLDFNDYSRQQILELINLVNGSSALTQFFSVAERAFKQWNHSIDFTNPVKFIEGQFKYPNIGQAKIIQCIRLLNNLCVFEAKSTNQYQQLIKAGGIQKAFSSFSSFLFNNEKALKLVSEKDTVKKFLVNNLSFLKRTIINNSEWQPLAILYSSNLNKLSEPYVSQVIKMVQQIVSEQFNAFSIRNLLTICKNIVTASQKMNLANADESLEYIIVNFMKGTQKQNDEVKLFRFFDRSINDLGKITKSEQKFLKQYACLNGDKIEPKNTGCFTLSQLEIVTNPVQFDKVMDNYYFSLDKNAKRFVQYLTHDWTIATQTPETNIAILKALIERYPIAIPLLVSTRVTINNTSSRFIEYLVREISAPTFELVKSIIQCRCIRYRNGRDYVREELVPIILKETIKKINQGSKKAEHFQLLALSISTSWPADIKIDIIQNSIETIKYQITQATDQATVFRLSNAHSDILKKFFQKKETDMRKKGLQRICEEQLWNENRVKLTTLQNQNNVKPLQKAKISEQIMISPYTSSQDFDAETSKMQKLTAFPKKVQQDPQIDTATLQKDLSSKAAANVLITEKKNDNITNVDLSSLKYNIESHLGSQIKHYCRKEGFRLITRATEEEKEPQNIQQNVSFVQYYLKEFQVPEVSSQIVLKYLHALLTNKVSYCGLFSNTANLQKLFASLMLLLGFYSRNLESPKDQSSILKQLLTINPEQKIKTVKTILKTLSAIGYTNLWAQKYNNLKNLSYLFEFRTQSQFKEESDDQTFFSWVLRLCLQNQELKDQVNTLLGQIFTTRPRDQNALMYKVTLDRNSLNLIMKSLQIENLSYVSLLFHSNYNNLRLYTDQLHQGLKSLGMSSKNRAYNQYIKLSKDLEDQEFYTPMKLFKENFSFFIRIENQGYKFKREEEQKIAKERVLKALRSGASGAQLNNEIQKVIQEFEVQLQKLQQNIASRVKAFYLATKLRDLSYQNSITICLLYQILSEAKESNEAIVKKIQCIEIFSLMMQLFNDLIRFQKSQQCENFLLMDRSLVEREVNICTTRRYSHSMSKVYEKCDLQLDQVIQRCIDNLKYFFISKLGRQWLSKINVYTPFLTQSFIDTSAGEKLIARIKQNIDKNNQKYDAVEFTCTEQNYFSNIVKGIRDLKKGQLLSKNAIKIKMNGRPYSLSDFLTPLKEQLIKSQTLTKSKDGFLLFNRYKTSENTLEEIQLLGLVVGHCIFYNIQMDLPLHSSLLEAAGFSICDIQDLLDVDFKVWEDLRNVMSVAESKELNLTFSYLVESLQTLKPERVELLDKGTSKKVNNLNRQQYCDLVCCHLLYKSVSKQVHRFLQAITYICPKQLLSCLLITQMHRFFIKKHPKYSESILRQHMKKRGLVQPDTVLSKGKRIQNLKDYQTTQWLCELVEQNNQLKQKIWKNQTNLFVCTWMGKGVEYEAQTGMLLLGRFKNKDELKQALTTIR